MKSFELFSGAGGLALGIANAGFHHEALVEWDKYAVDTLLDNQRAGLSQLSRCQIHRMDVRDFSYSNISGTVDLVAGGPPCQPFSMGGKHQAFNDARDMFPSAVRAVRELQPRAFIFENVKGLRRSAFANYLEYIRLQLSFPMLVRNENEDWTGHLSRLESHSISRPVTELDYNVVIHWANAADYGVPQRRERVFIIGFRSDLAAKANWSFPLPTHSEDALIWDKWISNNYWKRNTVRINDRADPTHAQRNKISKLEIRGEKPEKMPWVTVREAVSDLPKPTKTGQSRLVTNHKYQSGARVYTGHTGSPIDEPSKALKAGVHGVPGGENMIRYADASVRYFTVRESARLQCFPDEFVFHGSWTETMRQLGNAVPVGLAQIVASSVHEAINT